MQNDVLLSDNMKKESKICLCYVLFLLLSTIVILLNFGTSNAKVGIIAILALCFIGSYAFLYSFKYYLVVDRKQIKLKTAARNCSIWSLCGNSTALPVTAMIAQGKRQR